MALSLGLENIQTKEIHVSTEELLQSELDFQEAYQTFVDYKNVCEIVVKSKVSEESMTFANSLLNVSVENIEVSVEELADKLKAVWQKFVAMWEKFIGWIKEAFSNIVSKFSRGAKLPVEVNPSRSVLGQCINKMRKAISERKESIDSPTPLSAVLLSSFDDQYNTESLKTKEDVSHWIKLCKEFITLFDKEIQHAKKIWSEYNERGPKGEYQYKNIVKRIKYYTLIGPKIIAKLQKTIAKL